jgi:hypothetical protein
MPIGGMTGMSGLFEGIEHVGSNLLGRRQNRDWRSWYGLDPREDHFPA